MTKAHGNPVGLIPAAGLASRLGVLPCSKELLPVADGVDGPRPVAHFLLEGLTMAGVDQAIVGISPTKLDLIRGLGSGGRRNWPRLSYVPVESSRGTADTIAQLLPYARGQPVLIGFPDTVFHPTSMFVRLSESMRSGADCLLGLFPTDRLDKYDMVDVDTSGRVVAVHVKPGSGPWKLTWLIAGWSARFGEFLTRWVAGPPPGELHLGFAIQDAITSGLHVQGINIPDVEFLDVGTPEDLRAAMQKGWTSLRPSDTG
jgi:glucose-1-phosphate thymidylyltransferase